MSAFLAGLLSLVAPGSGQILIGNFTEGIIIGLLFIFTKPVIIPLIIRFARITKLRSVLKLLYACNLFYMALIIYALVRSILSAWHVDDWYVWYALIFIFCTTITYKNIFNEFIFSALCARTEIYNWARGKANSPTEKTKK